MKSTPTPGRRSTSRSASSGPLIDGITTSVSRRSKGSVTSSASSGPAAAIAIALALEHLSRETAHDVLVFDEQDGLRPDRRGLHRRDGLGGLLVRAREDDAELRAGAGGALHADLAARLLDDPVDHREPETGALADGLRAEERLEDARARLLVHAVAGVGDRDDGVAVLVARGDREGASVRHRVARVHCEIDEHLPELARVGVHAHEIRIEVRDDGDALADHPVEQRLRLDHHVVEVDHGAREHLAAAEGQQLPREICRAAGGGPHLPRGRGG